MSVSRKQDNPQIFLQIIQVAVKKKLPLSELIDEEKIPAFLDGVATDVIEGDLNLVKLGDVLKT